MRAAHRAAGQPYIYKWDVFERPYYTWDTFERPYYTWDMYERPYYTWDVFNRTATAWDHVQYTSEETDAMAFNISFTGGYFYTHNGYYNIFDHSTGKFDLDWMGDGYEITADTTIGLLSAAWVSRDTSGRYVDAIVQGQNDRIVKNTELGRFEFDLTQYENNGWYAVETAWGKGSSAGTTVTSFVSTTYPADGYDSGTELYYVRRAGTTLPPLGTTVTGFIATDYPSNGYDAGTDKYYILRAGVTKTPVGTATSFVNTTYPSNGYDVGTDLWYEIRAGWTKTPTGDVAWSVLDDTYPEAGYDEVTDLWYERR